MQTERPQEPAFPENEGTPQQRDYVREYRDVMDPDEAGTPLLREYVLAYQAGRVEARKWDAEVAKQAYVQWPAAWADEMLKRRSA